jgi:hypothetical protein
MFLRTARLLVASVVLLTAGRVGFGEWVDADSAAGQYVAKFPVKPREVEQTVKVGIWTLTNHAASIARKDGFEWTLMWCDYPPETAQGPDSVYARIIKGYQGDATKKVLADRKVVISGHEGHELEVSLADGSYHRVQLVMAGQRLYQVMAYAPATKKSDPEVTKFFDSFGIRTVHDFPTRGFRVEAELGGWVRMTNEKAKTAMFWGLPADGGRGYEALLTVESGKAAVSGAEEMAKSLAASWGGKVLTEKVMLDGEAGYRVKAANTTASMDPVEALVVERKGLMYLVVVGQKPGQECHEKVEEVRKGWKWEERVGVSEHLGFMPVPRLVLGNTMLLNYPGDMYINKVEKPEQEVNLSLPDERGSGPFQAVVQVLPVPEGSSFVATKENFLKQMNAKKLVEGTLTWTARRGDEARVVTGALRVPGMSPDPKMEGYEKWGMIQLDKGHVVLMNFTIGAANEEEKKRYEAAAEGIVDSIEAVK